MGNQALEGIKLVDLSTGIAGPYGSKLFADFGAEVIKVEDPKGGDPCRYWGPFFQDDPHPEKSGLFLHLNTNKKGITLNVESEFGKKVIKELVRDADILIESYGPGVINSLGLGYSELEKINPRLVMVSISNFGPSGPYKDYKGTEITMFAMCGRMFITGHPDKEPLKLGGTATTGLVGNAVAAAAMSAYFGAQIHGTGQEVEVSVLQALLGAVDNRLISYEYDGEIPKREGGRREGTYPSGFYFANDGYVQVAGGGTRRWPRVAVMLDMPELTNDPRFATAQARQENHGDFDALFYPWIIERSKYEIVRKAQDARMFAAPVLNMGELVEDEHYNKHRQFFVEIDHPVVGKVRYTGAPAKMTESPWQVPRHAPLFGEHNEEIYCERLGYSPEDLSKLREQGSI
ncbi:MAG: CoA transferase [Dehalococcoidia bacterium]|nr:CoA transferase [Dehalococcoidia bacterium]